MINCTREQLEDEEFKNTELGEEWWRYTDGNISVSYLDGNTKKMDGYNISIIKTTPRLLMQLLGTECGREILHPNLWVNALFSQYQLLGIKTKVSEQHIEFLSNIQSDKILPNVFDGIYPNWVITDMRFPNELKAVQERDGITIRVERHVDKNNIPIIRENEHESETALDDAGFNYIIDNNCSINQLIELVKEILILEKLYNV